MLAGVPHEFSFNLVNGFSDQHSPAEMVVSSRQNYITTHEGMDNDPTVPAEIYNAQANDKYPMYIRNVSWEVRDIGQTSPYRKCSKLLLGVCVVCLRCLSSASAPVFPLCLPHKICMLTLVSCDLSAACASNVITTTIQPSVPIYHSCLASFTITGLTGSATNDNGQLPLSNILRCDAGSCTPVPSGNVLQEQASWTR